MKFRVSQTFERLGDWCAQLFATSAEAEAAAEKLKAEIAAEVAQWDIPECPCNLGWSHEVAAFQEAADIAGEDAETYGMEAGQFIADMAVEIERLDSLFIAD